MEIKNKQESADIGSPENAKRYLDKAFKCENEARALKMKASNLESQVKRKLRPESDLKLVKQYEADAREKERQAKRYKDMASRELRINGEIGSTEVDAPKSVVETAKAIESPLSLEECNERLENRLQERNKNKESDKLNNPGNISFGASGCAGYCKKVRDGTSVHGTYYV